MKLVLSGYYGFQNTGDELILKIIVNELRQRYPEAIIQVFCEDSMSIEKNHLVKSIPKGKAAAIRALRGARAFIIGGGGLFQDHGVLGWRGIMVQFKRTLVAFFLNTSIIILGVGVAPLRTKIGKILTFIICLMAKAIVVRDEESKKALIECGVQAKKITVTCDLVFSLAGTISPKPTQVIGCSIFPYFEQVLGENVKQEWFEIKMAEILDALSIQMNSDICFITMQNDSHGGDGLMAKRVLDKMEQKSRAYILPYQEDIERTINTIASCRLVIAMRLHANILAYLANIPFYGISYHDKVDAFFHEFAPEQFCRAENIDVAAVIKKILWIQPIEYEVEKYRNFVAKSFEVLKYYI